MTGRMDDELRVRRAAIQAAIRTFENYYEDLDAVTESAGELWAADEIAPWLDRQNAFLRGTPRELVQRGEAERVLAMLEALKDGVVW